MSESIFKIKILFCKSVFHQFSGISFWFLQPLDILDSCSVLAWLSFNNQLLLLNVSGQFNCNSANFIVKCEVFPNHDSLIAVTTQIFFVFTFTQWWRLLTAKSRYFCLQLHRLPLCLLLNDLLLNDGLGLLFDLLFGIRFEFWETIQHVRSHQDRLHSHLQFEAFLVVVEVAVILNSVGVEVCQAFE